MSGYLSLPAGPFLVLVLNIQKPHPILLDQLAPCLDRTFIVLVNARSLEGYKSILRRVVQIL